MRTRKEVERCVSTWQKRLGLEYWEIDVMWEKSPNEDAEATTWRLNKYDRAEMMFEPGFVTWSKLKLNRIVVHELLHLHTRDVDRVFAEMESHMHQEAYKALDARYEHEIEGVVDRLACRIVDMVGLA